MKKELEGAPSLDEEEEDSFLDELDLD